MRMTAPAVGGAAVVLAAALVWLFQPEAAVTPEGEVTRDPVAETAPAAAEPSAPAVELPTAEAPAAESALSSPPRPERAPLPGETPTTPMAELVAERQNIIGRAGAGGPPADGPLPENIAAVELVFGTEPVDRTWAPGAEAAVFAAFAQIPGLKLIDQQVECRSTMCRIQLTQPGSAVMNGERVPFNMLSDSIGLTPRWMMVVGAGGTTLRSVGYFWREGFAPSEQPDQPHRSN